MPPDSVAQILNCAEDIPGIKKTLLGLPWLVSGKESIC